MTIALGDRGIAAVLLDIEGTTTPIAFVHDTLFPFARAHLRAFLDDPRDAAGMRDVESLLTTERAADAAAGAKPPPWRDATPDERRGSIDAYARWLMDRDRKSPGLKLLQGRIWERGYRAGLLKGEVFADTPGAIRRWHAAGLAVAIYSSGSALVQRLLFSSTPDGDLTPLLSGFFDTGVGPKTAPESYVRIAAALRHPPSHVLFVSDVTAELTAARAAGLQVVLSIRPGNPPQPAVGSFEAVRSLDELI